MADWNVIIVGMTGRNYSLTVKETTKVDDLLKMVADKEGVSKESVYLIFENTKLLPGEGKTLKDVGMKDGATLFLVIRTPGGIKQQGYNYCYNANIANWPLKYCT